MNFVDIPQDDWRAIVRWHRQFAPDPIGMELVSRDLATDMCSVPRETLIACLWVARTDLPSEVNPEASKPEEVDQWRALFTENSDLGSIGPLKELGHWLDYYARCGEAEKATTAGLIIYALEEALKTQLLSESDVTEVVHHITTLLRTQKVRANAAFVAVTAG